MNVKSRFIQTVDWLMDTGAFLFVVPMYILAGIIRGIRKAWWECHER